MRTILIILAVLLIISLGLNAWTLSQINTMKKELNDQGKKVSNLVEQVNNLKGDTRKERKRPVPERKVVVAFDDDPLKGDPDAPVTIVEFSDYQCPFCRKFHNEVLPRIEEEYISAGKVRYIFRDFPLRFHEKAIPAAVAANCAGEQGKYWVMNDFLFNNPSRLDKDSTLASARELGIDEDKFRECINNEEQVEEVKSDLEMGRKYGVRGTPSFFIGPTGDGKEMEAVYLRGLRSFETLKPVIEKQLR